MRPDYAVVCALVVASACGTSGVPATVGFLDGAGASPMTAPVRFTPPPPFGTPLVASPDKVKVTFKKLELQNGQSSYSSADLADCEVTFDRSAPSGTHSLDCAFTIEPGTYDTIRVVYDATVQVLIDDPVNSFYTDPTSPNLLSSTPPAGGAQFVPYTQAVGDGTDAGFGIPLYPPVEIDANSTAFSLIGDLNRTIQISDGTDPPNLLNKGHFFSESVNIVAVPGAEGSAEFYQDQAVYSPTGDNTSHGLKIFYGPNGQPVTTIMPPGTCGWDGLGFAYEFGAAQVATQGGTNTGGAYLGQDSTGTIAWEEPGLQGWSTSVGLFEIKKATAIADQETLQCQTNATNMPPGSGDTYASGAPQITATTSLPLYLRAH